MMKQFLANAPNSNSSIWHQSLGGAVGRVASDDSAYYYRKAITAQEYIATWENRDEEKQNISWIEALRKELSPYTAGDYVNFPDRYIKDWPKAYYGDNFRRLREVKTKYDPFNLFYFLQSIPPYKGWF
ncbi:Berberine/berberine-like domain-containing protein [Lederbergia lenta]